MSLVGRVGSLISQGVYSVATPFHPFGGAVDVIVVQQQDGTFRSNPWYVRFGKFQGVLKGAEKIVRIEVNGTEANFHMYLDNSGEAYFIHDSGKVGEKSGNEKDSDPLQLSQEGKICKLEHSVSDSGVARLREEQEELVRSRLDRTESDVDRRYYDFPDDPSSPVSLSEFGSDRYDSLGSGPVAESQGSDSEVILVSVDGHILTAPVSVSEEVAENVQLSTPQFHLGPGEGAEEFNSGDDAWADKYISKLKASPPDATSDKFCSGGNDELSYQHHLEGQEECSCQIQETRDVSRLEEEIPIQSDSEDASARSRKEDVFGSCLALTELGGERVGKVTSETVNSSLGVEIVVEEEPPQTPSAAKVHDGSSDDCFSAQNSDSTRLDGSPSSQIDIEATETSVVETQDVDLDTLSNHSVNQEPRNKELHASTVTEEPIAIERQTSEDHDPTSEAVQDNKETSPEEFPNANIRIELSVCGKELQAGMGLDAAARVFEAHRVSVEDYKSSAISIAQNEHLIVRYEGKYLPWEKAAPIVLGIAAYDIDLPFDPKDAIPIVRSDTETRDDESGLPTTPSSRRWRLWPNPFRRVKTLEHTSSTSSSEELFVDTESGSLNSIAELPAASPVRVESPHKQYVRTNVPTSEQIASLNLKDGQNLIKFSFSTRVLGTQQVDAHIYLWKWNARIVISDVDGTITKSDVLGQFMPLVGKDWSQSGVATLFSAIKENGYQLLFLSARAIVQAYLTRSFLFNLKQDGKTLPTGPVVISPDGLFPSLYREVIRRAPHEFKIACLEDIRKLFPADYNPFYAGFGNRDTDELSYRKIGIPKGKIFIINPKGEVAISHRIDVKSYTSLHTLVNDMFPPTSLVEQEDYNSWNFWRMPLPDVDL
ncbi:Phosphatidate phosphatase PAH1 [Linum grandiflorum]